METTQNLLNRLALDIRMRGMSESTQRLYVRYAGQFLEQSGKAPEELDESDARAYLIRLLQEGRVSASTISIMHSAMISARIPPEVFIRISPSLFLTAKYQ